MMFFNTHNHTENFEEEEDEEDMGIDDTLLGELDDDIAEEDDELLLGEELSPLKIDPFATEEEDPLKDDIAKLYGEDEEEDEDSDYDSFDDRDEM